MQGKVLVAYATRAGSTAEVAEAIGKTLAGLGAEVDVSLVQDVRDVESYDAVIVGSAARTLGA